VESSRIPGKTRRREGARRRDAILALYAAVLVILALLTVFAIELSNTQARSKRDVEARVHERAVLAAALIDSLFQTSRQQLPQLTKTYGARTVTAATMNRNRETNAYVALLDSGERVLVASRGFTAQARADLKISAALALIRSGHPYGLGNLLPYGRSGVINYAVTFPTASGRRILLTGFTPGLLSQFLAGDLKQIPGVKGAHSYVLDGNGAVLASTNPARPVGYVFRSPSQIAALRHSSGDAKGHYYDQVQLTDSSWRIVLSAPNGPLFASVTGLRKWVPWLIFVAFALVAAVALLLGSRALRAADELHHANARLESLNDELETTNSALERRAAELARSNSELEHFASIASHDLQEPLRKVRTFTEQITVTESDRLSEKGKDYLDRANGAAARMQKLIEDLLKYSRVATHGRPFESVDLNDITSEVLDDLEVQVERTGAHVHVGELPTISADPLQMRQLMQNLISNALKFRREGTAPEVTITGAVQDGSATVSVADNGIGFDPQYRRRIFRVFERLNGRSEYPGTGIGLALCRRIVERHGGTVIADSTEGAGATFTVTLPLTQTAEVLTPEFEPDPAESPEEELGVHA
jgi:signal transduction histidine kinase